MRVLLEELPSRRIIDWAVPLRDATFTRSLTGPNGLTGILPEGYPHPTPEWGCALWVEAGGRFHGGGILTTAEHQDRQLRIDCTGVTGYWNGQPWLAPREDLIQVDPLDIVRKVIDHLQSYPAGDLHLTVDPTTTPVRVGEEERQVEFTTKDGQDVAFDTGPFRLNPVDAQDLGKLILDLAADTPFDFLEHTYWDAGKVAHRLELAYPGAGVVRRKYRFDTTLNLQVLPTLGFADSAYASEVLMIGAGEGRDAITGHVPADATRLRRVAVVADKSLRSRKSAVRAAREELARRTSTGDLSDLTVIDTPAAPIADLGPGDTIHITGPLHTGAVLDHWVRIIEITRSLDDLTTADLAVVPA